MTKRELIAAALLGLGFLVWLGTVGDADFHGMWSDEYYIRVGIGMALCFAAVPVSGDVPRKESEDNKDE
ncbi:MAG: hypothetical protein K2O14_12480 [Oscillospiraceae bacterium]|nr:hypothetical protein [Oscillospiraceae bacterium]